MSTDFLQDDEVDFRVFVKGQGKKEEKERQSNARIDRRKLRRAKLKKQIKRFNH